MKLYIYDIFEQPLLIIPLMILKSFELIYNMEQISKLSSTSVDNSSL
jgi:hypothetical protein